MRNQFTMRKAKRFNVGYRKGPKGLITINMFRGIGLRFDRCDVFHLGTFEALEALRDRRIEAMMAIGGMPHPTMVKAGGGADLIWPREGDREEIMKWRIK